MSNLAKTALVRHANPDNEIAKERSNRGWLSHVVGLLVLSSKGDRIAMTVPDAAIKNDAPQVLIPPQLRMSATEIRKVYRFGDTESIAKHVHLTALVAAREFLNIPLKEDMYRFHTQGTNAMARDKLVYIGSTRGNDNRGGNIVRNAKYFHWVAIRLDRADDVFRTGSSVYHSPQWCSANRLVALPQSLAMSDRKGDMVKQSLLKYAEITGDYNKLASVSQKFLQAA